MGDIIMKSKLQSLALAASLSVSLGVLSSCSKDSKPTGGSDQKLAGNILGGTVASADFQKQNGVVGILVISEKPAAVVASADQSNSNPDNSPAGGQPAQRSMAICTGSLLSSRVVLTAAHCLLDPNIKAVAVIFGTDMQTATKDQVRFGSGGSVMKNFNPNQDSGQVYSDGHEWNDAAVIKLSADAPADFKFANLPDANAKLTASDTLTAAGYGVTNALVNKLVKDPVTGRDSIQPLPSTGDGTLRSVSGVKILEVSTNQKEILISNSNGKKGICHGDSGGPAYLQKADGSYVLVGITSRVTQEIGNCNENAVYTGVIGQLDWIKSQL